jgi:hypothetical protein
MSKMPRFFKQRVKHVLQFWPYLATLIFVVTCQTSNLHVMYNLQHLKIRHVLDVMHCEKNLCENILKTLFGMNDSPGSRQDVQDLNIRPEIWLQPPRRQGDQYYMPHAPYILKPMERSKFVSIVSSIRTPTNYVGAIHKRLQDGKLQYMKSHDYHVLMQQVRYSNILHTCTLLRVCVGTNTSHVNIDIVDAVADNPHDTEMFARQ